jgi:hypothetical protein
MEQSERRIGEPYLLTMPFIGDIINGKRTDFDTLSYYDKVRYSVYWHELLHTYEREIEEDVKKVSNLIILYSNIEDVRSIHLSDMDILELLEKGESIHRDPISKELYSIDEDRLLKDKPFLKKNAYELEGSRKESYIYDAPVVEELTPIKSYLQAIIDLDSILSCYRGAVGNAAIFVAHKQDETLKETASDFSPRANTAKCKEAEELLNTYFKPKEKFEYLNNSQKTDVRRAILGGILTEEDNNDYSGRKTNIQKKEVLNALSTLVEFYEPKDNWWKDLALHNNKLAKCKVLATITNCKYESIRNFSKKKEGESGKIKEALFGK